MIKELINKLKIKIMKTENAKTIEFEIETINSLDGIEINHTATKGKLTHADAGRQSMDELTVVFDPCAEESNCGCPKVTTKFSTVPVEDEELEVFKH